MSGVIDDRVAGADKWPVKKFCIRIAVIRENL